MTILRVPVKTRDKTLQGLPYFYHTHYCGPYGAAKKSKCRSPTFKIIVCRPTVVSCECGCCWRSDAVGQTVMRMNCDSERRCLIIESPRPTIYRQKIRPARRPPGRGGFLQLNCRPGETFLGGDPRMGGLLWAGDILIREKHIKSVIISPRADFSWGRHFNVTPAPMNDVYTTLPAHSSNSDSVGAVIAWTTYCDGTGTSFDNGDGTVATNCWRLWHLPILSYTIIRVRFEAGSRVRAVFWKFGVANQAWKLSGGFTLQTKVTIFWR